MLMDLNFILASVLRMDDMLVINAEMKNTRHTICNYIGFTSYATDVRIVDKEDQMIIFKKCTCQ